MINSIKKICKVTSIFSNLMFNFKPIMFYRIKVRTVSNASFVLIEELNS
ncbi:hypothetical protein REIS_1726 [Rickettsia endosymbiont of Ixodes scapularis]|nr:hypothetical protein REIS_1726 [Rickettsia endosymbiont of Ixodes scapularis]